METELGLSPFRVDLAVRRPGDAAWRVAVRLDGWRWRQRATVGDREGLPTNVPQGMMGWSKVVRVWLPAWQAEQEALLDEIVQAVDAAKEGAGREAARAAMGQVAPGEPKKDTSASAGSSSSVFDGLPMPAQNSSRPVGPAPVFASAGATAAPRPDSTQAPIVHKPYGPNAKEFIAYEPKEGRGPQEACEPPTVSRLLATSVAEVLASEWPIEAGRLAKLVSVEFGIKRLASQRLEFIVRAARYRTA